MKPPWDTYYLSQCFLLAQRSLDPNTKCGAMIVSEDGRVLSQGYNGPLKGIDDDVVPLERPTKYYHMIHAEENAILSYNGSYQDIKGSTIYITGSPCHKCLRMIIQKGIGTIVYPSDFPITKCQDDADLKAAEFMVEQSGIRIRPVEVMNSIFKMFDKTKFYMSEKLNN
jgi:dCMP deaminase